MKEIEEKTGVSYEELLNAFLTLFNILVDVKKVFAKTIGEFDDAILLNNEKAVTVLEKLVKSEVVTTDDEKGEVKWMK